MTMVSRKFPDEIWRSIISMLPRQNVEAVALVSKHLRSICADFFAEVMVFPSVDPHPRRYKYKERLDLYRSDLRATVLARKRTLDALSDPVRAHRIKEIHVTGEIPKVVWNRKKEAFEDTNDYQRWKLLQELELRELASYLPKATGLRILRIKSCSRSNAVLCSSIRLLPALQYCRLPCATQLPSLRNKQPASISIDASDGYHPDAHIAQAPNREVSLDQVRRLEIGGETAYLADIDLSSFPSITNLVISTDKIPFQYMGGPPIPLERLVILGLEDVSLEPDLRFHQFLRKISLETLAKLTIGETSLWGVAGGTHLVFNRLETLEIFEVTYARGIYQQEFPRIRNVSFSTSREKEVNDFLAVFVDRHSSHLEKILIQRRIEKRLLLNGSRPCLTARRYEILSPQAVKSLLSCRLKVFALDGRVYFRPEDWIAFCAESYSSTLMQVYIAPPNALIKAEEPFKNARETVAPFGLVPYHGNRLFFRPPLDLAWCKEVLHSRVEERRQFLREVDPMHDFTETSRNSEDMTLDDICRALESKRTDVCVCRPGEEIYSKWYSQKRDFSSDSEEEYSTATENGTLPGLIEVACRGKVYQYEPWATCPSLIFQSHKRRRYSSRESGKDAKGASNFTSSEV